MTTKDFHKFRSKTQTSLSKEELFQALNDILDKLKCKMIEQNGNNYLVLPQPNCTGSHFSVTKTQSAQNSIKKLFVCYRLILCYLLFCLFDFFSFRLKHL